MKIYIGIVVEKDLSSEIVSIADDYGTVAMETESKAKERYYKTGYELVYTVKEIPLRGEALRYIA